MPKKFGYIGKKKKKLDLSVKTERKMQPLPS